MLGAFSLRKCKDSTCYNESYRFTHSENAKILLATVVATDPGETVANEFVVLVESVLTFQTASFKMFLRMLRSDGLQQWCCQTMTTLNTQHYAAASRFYVLVKFTQALFAGQP